MNTFLTYKLDIQNTSISSSLLQIATGIANSLQTGWAIDSKNLEPDGTIQFLEKEQEEYYYIILNHSSGSSFQLGYYEDSETIPVIAYIPAQSSYSMPISKNNSLNVQFSALVGNLFAQATFPLWLSIDTRGNGFVFYYKESNDVKYAIIGSYIQQFCYPQEINNILNTIFILGYSNNFYFADTWKTAILDHAESDSFGFQILNLFLLLDENSEHPYGYVDKNLLAFLAVPSDTTITDGNILTNGNYIIYNATNDYKYALGWSPLNTKDNNPWYLDE